MSHIIAGIAALLLGLVVGYLAAALRAARREEHDGAGQVRTQLAVERARADALDERVTEVADAGVAREQVLRTEHQARLSETSRAAADREDSLADAHERYVVELRAEHARYVARVTADQDALREQFKSLAGDVLKSNNKQFLEVASERMTRAQQLSDAELAKREDSVKKLVEPMSKALDDVRRQTTEADKARAAGQSTLSEQVRQMVAASDKLDKKASDFINTLRRSDVRGNWGEVQLRRVVELAGMVNHVDFEEQENVRDSDGKNLRPDMTVKLAGGRTIVVDSKVALSALLEAFETEDEEVRADRLRAHARQVKTHVDDLSGKKYWDQFPSAPEFVVMFLPSEAFYQSALEQDPALQEYAFGKNVVIATPTTLVAMLRTVAHAWREDTLAQNAQQILAAGKDLYERLSVMGGHLSKVGKALDSASKAYNSTVASMESRVMVSARKFGDMQAISADIPAGVPAEVDVRQVSAPEFSEVDGGAIQTEGLSGAAEQEPKPAPSGVSEEESEPSLSGASEEDPASELSGAARSEQTPELFKVSGGQPDSEIPDAAVPTTPVEPSPGSNQDHTEQIRKSASLRLGRPKPVLPNDFT